MTLINEINSLQSQLEEMSIKLQSMGDFDPSNYVSVELYNAYVLEEGKRELQVIFLLSENSRLKDKNADLVSYLEKAEDFIMELQNNQGSGDS